MKHLVLLRLLAEPFPKEAYLILYLGPLIFQFLILPMCEDVSLFFCLIYRKIFRTEHSPSLILTLRFLSPQFHFLSPSGHFQVKLLKLCLPFLD